jgi:hypothetical protein
MLMYGYTIMVLIRMSGKDALKSKEFVWHVRNVMTLVGVPTTTIMQLDVMSAASIVRVGGS